MRNLIKFYSFIIILALLLSCHKEATKPPVYTDQGNIGKQGGTVKTTDGASIDIPGGALDSDQTISITNTTQGKIEANTGAKIFELKPDGLTFSDSITLTLPFDNKHIDLNSKEENYGVGIMVFKDSSWVKLKTKVNLQEKTAQAKTTHFSVYLVFYPTGRSDYFEENKSISQSILSVPYYFQGNSQWCAFYSLSMAMKFAGYQFKAPQIAVEFYKGINEPLNLLNYIFTGPELSNLGVSTEIALPSWGNINELCGYLMEQLNNNNPVCLGIPDCNHMIIVTGHDKNGFYVNDPYGTYLKTVPGYDQIHLNMVLIPYDKFITSLSGPNNKITILIKSKGTQSNSGTTINFNRGNKEINITSGRPGSSDTIGSLILDGKVPPNGYYLYNFVTRMKTFSGYNYISISPLVANSDLMNDVVATLQIKVDNKEMCASQTINITKGVTSYIPKAMSFQLKNLIKGSHVLTVELKSEDLKTVYDYWDFELSIENEFIDNNTDVDGNSFNTVTIGTQTWMRENLKVTKYNDGTSIPNVTDVTQWQNLTAGAYCWYNNNITNKDIYGALYNWYTIDATRNGGKNVCPSGWHVPTDNEWTILTDFLGGLTVSSGKLKETGSIHWFSPNTGATNETGFTALPAGWRESTGTFWDLSFFGSWWSTTENSITTAWDRVIHFESTIVYRGNGYKPNAFSIRCIKNN